MTNNSKIDDVYGPIARIIKELKGVSEDDRDTTGKLFDKIMEVVGKTQRQIDSLTQEFAIIQKTNLELTEKMRKMDEANDNRMAKVEKGDLAISRKACENIYANYWEKLDELSKKYLAMAHYMRIRFEIEAEADYSPLVIELGRAVENELIKKIYDGFVKQLSTKTLVDNGRLYPELKTAVRSFNSGEGTAYIAGRTMVKYLSYLADETIENDYNEALKNYLLNNRINKDVVSSPSFTGITDNYIDEYRNKAAHAGYMMNSSTAERCREKTKKILKRFMSAVQN